MDQEKQFERRLAQWAPWLLAVYAVGLWAMPLVEVDALWLAFGLSVLSWLLFTALLLTLTACFIVLDLPRRWVVLALLLCVAGWAGFSFGFGDKPPLWTSVLAQLFVLAGMAALGQILSWLFREPSLLPPVLVLAGLIDIWGVRYGPTAKVAEANPELIAKASAKLPGVTSLAAEFGLLDLSIGPGDVAVAALVLAVVIRAGFGLKRNLVWMYLLTIAGLALVLITGMLIPGLVFIGLAGILANWRRFHYSAEEKRNLAIAFGLILVLLGFATLALRATRSEGTDDGNLGPAAEVRVQGD